MKAKLAAFTLLLGSCASLESPNPASPYFAYTTGWSAQLNRPLTIPRDAATVRLQYGEIVPRNSVQEQDPYCVVELNTVRAEPQVLQPGRFDVRRVTRQVETLAAVRSPYIKVSHDSGDSGPSFLYYKTVFQLRDPTQPDLRSLTCAWDQMAPGNRSLMRHLTLAEIRGALGSWMMLISPGERM